jgi:hypothetical protein
MAVAVPVLPVARASAPRHRRFSCLVLLLIPAGLFTVCGGCLVIGTIVQSQAEKAARKALEQADKDYAEGRHEEAITAYKRHYSSSFKKPTVLKRIVEHEAGKGNEKEAREWIGKGIDANLEVTCDGPAARLPVEVKKAREEEAAARAKEAARKRAEEAKRREEQANEYEKNGLVLLKDTLRGEGTDHGHGLVTGKITGEVVNRRNRKLSYVQVTVSLYDDSGVQVGSALANVNGLEAGGKWKFEAVTAVRFAKFKVSDLTGF